MMMKTLFNLLNSFMDLLAYIYLSEAIFFLNVKVISERCIISENFLKIKLPFSSRFSNKLLAQVLSCFDISKIRMIVF